MVFDDEQSIPRRTFGLAALTTIFEFKLTAHKTLLVD
jgi:hypothetical protein